MKNNVFRLLAVIGFLFIQIHVFADNDIFFLIKIGTIDDIKTYLINGGNVNAKDENGRTLLIWAAMVRDANFVKMLIEAKADINQTQNGFSALMAATAAERPDMVKLLIMANANVNTINFQGFSALIIASSIGNLEIVKILIDAHADIGQKDKEGKAAIHWAAANGHGKIVELLAIQENSQNTNHRIVAGKWAFTIISVSNEGTEIINRLGTWQYTYRANNSDEILIRVKVELEELNNKPINDKFLSIDVKLRDSTGNLYALSAAGTANSDYYLFKKGGRQSLMLPVQAKANMDFLFSIPRIATIVELIWPDALPLRINVN